ncbi:autophagy-related protein 2 [Scheffersomyces xylosifermentans]|uniref:autophagy-related protein 2 n=1 Tax=Scheffersomyces xylosifermentans TaxID=1304137 RepID=UPI00315D9CD8
MSPQWIPQNIQKRLLLYVLQQLSLFSEIDLPNLEEVSLNNIILRDISIDPEKVGKLPGCNLRYGQVGTLELNTVSGGGIIGSGGVNIDAKDVEVVISPDFDIDEDVRKEVQFSLAQSTADLANTIIKDEDTDGTDTDEEVVMMETQRAPASSSSSTSSSSSNTSPSKPSALSGVMNRAVEMALSRLQIKITNLRIKLVSELTDLLFEVDEILVNTVNGSRIVKISGVRSITLKPNVNPGNLGEEDDITTNAEEGNVNNTTKQSNDNDNDEDDIDNDYGDESLMDSMVFTHEEASSIYMSATSQSFAKSDLEDTAEESDNIDNKKSDEHVSPTIFHLNYCDVEFEGLSSISNLKVDIGTVKFATTPLAPTIISIFKGITRSLKINYHQKKKQNSSRKQQFQQNSRFPQYVNENDEVKEGERFEAKREEGSDPFFSKIHIADIIVSTTSALHKDGEFASPDNTINITLHNLNIKQKNELLIYGGVETFKIIQVKHGESIEIFGFESNRANTAAGAQHETNTSAASVSSPPPRPVSPSSISSASSGSSKASTPKADIRFEIFKKLEDNSATIETTALFSKAATLTLDLSSSLILSNFFIALHSIYVNYMAMKVTIDTMNRKNTKGNRIKEISQLESETKSQFVLQTAPIVMTVKFADDLQLKAIIFPFSFNLQQDLLAISKALVTYSTKDVKDETIATISNINFVTKILDFKAFINRVGLPNSGSSLPREILISSSSSLLISKIKVELSMIGLKHIIKKVVSFHQAFSKLSNAQSNSMENSVLDIKKGPGSSSTRLDNSQFLSSSVYSTNHRKPRRLGPAFNSPGALNGTPFNTNRINLASFRCSIKEIEINLVSILPNFGDICVKLDDILLYQLKNDFQGSILSLKIQRRMGDSLENVIYDYQELPLDSIKHPLILIHCKSSDKINTVDVTIRNFLIEYYTNWLTLLGEDDIPMNEELLAEMVVEQAQPATPSSSQNRFDIRYTLYDCVVGLNPGRLSSKGYLVVSKGTSDVTFGVNQFYIKSSFKNISILLIDDINNVEKVPIEPKATDTRLPTSTYVSPLTFYLNSGYVCVGNINLTHIGITFNTEIEEIIKRNERLGIHENLSLVDLKINSDEHQLDLCADSTHVLLQLISDLKLPLNFLDEDKMKVTVDKKTNLLDDINQNQFQLQVRRQSKASNIPLADKEDDDLSSLSFEEDHFTKPRKGSQSINKVDPIKININLSKTKVLLYDGYDWKDTRKAVRGAVKRVEAQAKKEKLKQLKKQTEADAKNIDKAAVSSKPTTLFHSIHVGLPRGSNASTLAESINRNVQSSTNDLSDEDVKKAKINVELGKNYKNLKLRRSNVHKVMLDLKNIEVNVVVISTRDPRKDPTDDKMEFELLNDLEIRLGSLNIYDNVPSSTWNKFLSYMNILGEGEIGTSMVKVSITNVRPFPKLVSSEAIIRVEILPIRLHIDQDTLDFLMRFLQFKDSRFDLPPDEVLYIQKFSISPLKLKLDYKPKRVDYLGIRSGNAAEFMNFFILDGSTIKLVKATVYGAMGLPKLGDALKEIWAPQVQQTQIAGILAGLSPVRSIVNIGSGVKNLIAIPISEYKKDGRLLRSLQKGTQSFAKTTGYEILNLGVKLASGTQVILEQGEELLGGEGSSARLPSSRRKKGSSSSEDFEGSEDKRPAGESDDEPSPTDYITNGQITATNFNKLLATSQLLNQSVKLNKDQYGSRKLYSYADLDDEDDEVAVEKSLLSNSIFLLNAPREESGGDDEDDHGEFVSDEEEEDEKLISLYSNQPETIQEGIKLAYNSFGKNLKLTKRQIINLKKELNQSDNFQESLMSVIKSTPIILIRPIIGTTEALSKTLMGLSNEIDSKHMIESKDKYRYTKKSKEEESS